MFVLMGKKSSYIFSNTQLIKTLWHVPSVSVLTGFHCTTFLWLSIFFALFPTSHTLRKHSFLLALHRRGRFARRNICDSATEIPYWWRKQTNVYIQYSWGFQIQICPILGVFWSILVKCCVHLPTSSRKTQMLLLEKTIFHEYWPFC